MKRFRVKAVGLGLVLSAGSALAADGDWRPMGERGAPPVPVNPAVERAIWFPAREPVLTVVPAGGQVEPDLYLPPFEPMLEMQPTVLPVPVRVDVQPPTPIPQLQVPPVAKQADPPPQPPSPKGGGSQKAPFPSGRGVGGGGLGSPPVPLNPPRAVNPPLAAVLGELQPAPPELMYPEGAHPRHRHGTFGSPPLSISRDYWSIADVARPSYNIADDVSVVPSRVFVRGEYLLWWMPGFSIPVLATTNANPALNGFIGEPGTTPLLGPGSFLDSTRSGFRVRAGAWLDDDHTCGIDGSFFFLGKRSDTATFGSDRFPLITRPIFAPNLVAGTNLPLGEIGEVVAVPGILRGAMAVQGDSRLWGADANVRRAWGDPCEPRAELFAGYRHLNLRESLTITETINVIGLGGNRIGMADPIGTQVVVQDRFATRNEFHGGQLGAAYERRWGRWDMDTRASVALGTTRQTLNIDGFQTRQLPGVPLMMFRGGLLAVGPNLGRFTRDRFSVAPEVTLNVGYWLTDTIRVFGGYNFLYWTNVIRPGDQIDRVVDLTFVPNALPANFSGQFRPRPLFKQSDLAVNGLQFGLDWRW